MKKFDSPVLVDISDMAEGVYASSGSVPPVPSIPPADGEWKIYCEYRNHNSGSHSEVAIIGVHNGTQGGESITMDFGISGFLLDTVKDSSGYTVSNVSESGFTITRNGHFNGTDRFEFNIQITCKNSQYHGAVGQTGVFMPCTIYCTSYR